MYPVLLPLGHFNIYTYGFCIAIGFLIGLTLAKREAQKIGIDPEKIMDLAFYFLISGIVGSRLFYIATTPKTYLANPLEIFKIWEGGLVFYGAFIGALIAGFIYFKKTKLKVWPVLDVFTPSLAIGHFFGRIGCFFAGCCYGKVCDLPWAVTFTNPDSLAEIGKPLHPTQLYSAFSNLIIFFILTKIRPHKRFEGQLFWTYILIYGINRSIIETLRGDFRGERIFDLISISQAIGGSASILALIIIIVQFKRIGKSDQ